MKNKTTALLALLAALAVAGCASRSPTVRYYELDALVPSDGTLNDTPAVAVGPIVLPRVLDRPQMVTREGDSQIVIDEFHRWGSGLESEILSALGQNLIALLDSHRVAIYPTTESVPVQYRVLADFRDFVADSGNEVLLRVQWMVETEKDGSALIVRESTIRKQAASSGRADIVTAHNEAVAELSREIAAAIQSMAATGP